MVFVTISGTRLSPKTFSECRGKLAARRRIVERGACHLRPRRGAAIADERIEHAMRPGEDGGTVGRVHRIADRLDDALLVNFVAGFDVPLGGPMLWVIGV